MGTRILRLWFRSTKCPLSCIGGWLTSSLKARPASNHEGWISQKLYQPTFWTSWRRRLVCARHHSLPGIVFPIRCHVWRRLQLGQRWKTSRFIWWWTHRLYRYVWEIASHRVHDVCDLNVMTFLGGSAALDCFSIRYESIESMICVPFGWATCCAVIRSLCAHAFAPIIG